MAAIEERQPWLSLSCGCGPQQGPQDHQEHEQAEAQLMQYMHRQAPQVHRDMI